MKLALLCSVVMVTVMGASESDGVSVDSPTSLLTFTEIKEGLENSFKCPITQEYMTDPVITADGHTYEADEIAKWFATGRDTSPLTGVQLPHTTTVRNYALRAAIQEYIKTVPADERPVRPEPVAHRPEPVPAHAEPGVEVRDAGDTQVNGWYTRKEHAQGPPREWPDWANWAHRNGGRPWYEKDDDCFIYRHVGGVWIIDAPDGDYSCRVPADHDGDAPPARGWNVMPWSHAPAPTLQVVNH